MANYNRLKNLFDSFNNSSSYQDDPGFSRDDNSPDSDPGFQIDDNWNQDPQFYSDDNDPSGSDKNSVMDPRSPFQQAQKSRGQNPIESTSARTKEIMDLIGQINTPSTRSSDRLNNLLDTIPQRDTPSFGRSLVAGLATLNPKSGGDPQKTIDEIKYGRYNNAMADWKTKAVPFQQAATLENQQNVNERTLASSVANYAIQADRNRVTEQNNADKIQVANDLNEVKDFLARNKGFKAVTTGTTVVMYNESTGETQDTGIQTGKLSEIQKINLQNAGRLAVARQQGANSANVARIHEEDNNLYQDSDHNQFKIGKDGPETLDGEPYEPMGDIYQVGKKGTTPSTKPPTPAAERTARNNRFQQAWDNNGEEIRSNYIPPASPGADWQLGPAPEKGMFENSQSYQNKLNAYNRAKALVTTSSATSSTTPPSRSSNSPAGITIRPDQYGISQGGKSSPERSPSDYIPPTGGQNGGPVRRDNLPSPNVSIKPQDQLNSKAILEQKATDILRSHGQAVTPGNIQHMIDTGQVR